MSILIKGMEIPGGCETCKLKYRHQGAYVVDYCFPYMKCVDPWTFGKKRNGDKPDWCPLVEIPPHGRLKDADALKVMMPTIGDEYLYAREMIEDAPTVIEAEEEKE